MSTQDPFFVPLEQNTPLAQPEALVSDSENISSEVQNTFTLKPRRLKFLKPLLYIVLCVLVIVGGKQFYSTLLSLLELHWSLAALFGALGVAGLGLLGSVFIQIRLNQHDLELVTGLRDQADSFIQDRSFGQLPAYLTTLHNLYDGKPQAPLLENSLATMPDYSNDAEAIQHLSETFLSELDKAATRCVAKHSEQTALFVAVSPLILVDMLLALWRSAKMLDEVSQIYGLRPSLLGRWQLMKEVLYQVAFTGITELLSEHVAGLSTNTLLGKLSTKLAQGVGAGMYTARIGYKAMDVCRPIAFDKGNRPRIASELGQILHVFKKHGLEQASDAGNK